MGPICCHGNHNFDTVSEEKIFECFSQNLALYGAPATNQNQGLEQKLARNVKHYSINISAKTKFKCLLF